MTDPSLTFNFVSPRMPSLYSSFTKMSEGQNYEDILDITSLHKTEQKSRMYKNILSVFAMCENKPLKYEEVNDYLDSMYGKYTGAKTTCVYWRQTLAKEKIDARCNDPDCQEKEPHRLCSKAFYRKTRVIWVQRDLATKVFKDISQWDELETKK